MDKKIIFMKIPIQENAKYINAFSISPELVGHFVKYTKQQLGDDYTVIATPMDTTCISGNATVVKIDAKEYSYNELMEIIEKADMYDGLCE